MFGAFHWGVWLALFLTILCVGLLLGLFNRCSTIVSELTKEEQRDAASSPSNGLQRGDAVVLMPPSPVKAKQEGTRRRQNVRRFLRNQLGLRRGQRMAFVGHLGDHVWQVATTMSEGGIDPPRSLPGRILYATFLFLLLVMLSMFTANTGAQGLGLQQGCHKIEQQARTKCLQTVLHEPFQTYPPVRFPFKLAAGIITSMRLNSAINSRSDLAGKAVGVWDGYEPLLQTTEIAAVQLPWWVCRGFGRQHWARSAA